MIEPNIKSPQKPVFEAYPGTPSTSTSDKLACVLGLLSVTSLFAFMFAAAPEKSNTDYLERLRENLNRVEADCENLCNRTHNITENNQQDKTRLRVCILMKNRLLSSLVKEFERQTNGLKSESKIWADIEKQIMQTKGFSACREPTARALKGRLHRINQPKNNSNSIYRP